MRVREGDGRGGPRRGFCIWLSGIGRMLGEGAGVRGVRFDGCDFDWGGRGGGQAGLKGGEAGSAEGGGGSVFLLECRAVGYSGGAYSIARLTAELHLGHESLQIAVVLRIDLKHELCLRWGMEHFIPFYSLNPI